MTWAASRDGSPLLWVYLGMGLVVTAWMVRREYVRRPATLKFWDEGTGFPLNVRHVTTGRLMLQSKATTLTGEDLRGAKLAGANLSGVDLHGAKLEGADLTGANLCSAKLWSANIKGAVLRGADLRSADLDRASLQGADLRQARLGNASLDRTSFRDADLRGASFVAVGFNIFPWDNLLETADFAGARWNSATRWPLNFDPVSSGAVYEERGETDLPIPHDAEVTSEAMLPIPADGHSQTTEAASEVARLGVRS